jgi:hypothetical protein
MGRDLVATIVMVIVGVVLLLPGVCAAFFIVTMGQSVDIWGSYGLLWLICLGIAFGGVMLIRHALRSPDPGP